jgi:hypothetical protein
VTDVAAARGATLSSSLCAEALAALDRLFTMACPDEPDLGHNVTYVSARQWLRRIAATEPWTVPPTTVAAVRRVLAAAWSTDDPRALEAQLSAFRARVITRLERKVSRRDPSQPPRGAPAQRS